MKWKTTITSLKHIPPETFDFRKNCILEGQLSWSKPLGKKLLHYNKSSTHPRDW